MYKIKWIFILIISLFLMGCHQNKEVYNIDKLVVKVDGIENKFLSEVTENDFIFENIDLNKYSVEIVLFTKGENHLTVDLKVVDKKTQKASLTKKFSFTGFKQIKKIDFNSEAKNILFTVKSNLIPLYLDDFVVEGLSDELLIEALTVKNSFIENISELTFNLKHKYSDQVSSKIVKKAAIYQTDFQSFLENYIQIKEINPGTHTLASITNNDIKIENKLANLVIEIKSLEKDFINNLLIIKTLVKENINTAEIKFVLRNLKFDFTEAFNNLEFSMEGEGDYLYFAKPKVLSKNSLYEVSFEIQKDYQKNLLILLVKLKHLKLDIFSDVKKYTFNAFKPIPEIKDYLFEKFNFDKNNYISSEVNKVLNTPELIITTLSYSDFTGTLKISVKGLYILNQTQINDEITFSGFKNIDKVKQGTILKLDFEKLIYDKKTKAYFVGNVFNEYKKYFSKFSFLLEDNTELNILDHLDKYEVVTEFKEHGNNLQVTIKLSANPDLKLKEFDGITVTEIGLINIIRDVFVEFYTEVHVLQTFLKNDIIKANPMDKNFTPSFFLSRIREKFNFIYKIFELRDDLEDYFVDEKIILIAENITIDDNMGIINGSYKLIYNNGSVEIITGAVAFSEEGYVKVLDSSLKDNFRLNLSYVNSKIPDYLKKEIHPSVKQSIIDNTIIYQDDKYVFEIEKQKLNYKTLFPRYLSTKSTIMKLQGEEYICESEKSVFLEYKEKDVHDNFNTITGLVVNELICEIIEIEAEKLYFYKTNVTINEGKVKIFYNLKILIYVTLLGLDGNLKDPVIFPSFLTIMVVN